MTLLQLENISYGYIDGTKKRIILNELSYNFEKGKFYTILGPSGSGKTTLLSLIGALEKTQGGVIRFDGKKLEDIGYTNYRKNNQAIVFQQFNLITYMTPLENLLNVMNITSNELPKDKEKTALALLNRLGIVESKARRNVMTLSGGEQQRVAIARALSTNVGLILADEPTGNLDSATQREIVAILRSLATDYDTCVIVVTHSDEVANTSDIQLHLRDGKLIEQKGNIS
ncbi:MAG: ABC transporter ATP-binding protein [Erysipelotrichaceae bacterium]|nr:ABC transporter ATP-binding protein [Erysipelotrichaceae bacterium]